MKRRLPRYSKAEQTSRDDELRPEIRRIIEAIAKDVVALEDRERGKQAGPINANAPSRGDHPGRRGASPLGRVRVR
jgi:hypothetical protein